MQLLGISIADFRNLESVTVEPHPRFTIVGGENGQGKTNLLEAIYYVLCLRPLRSVRLHDLVRIGQPAAKIAARIEAGGVREEFRAVVDREGRHLARNSKSVDDPQRYLMGGAVVAFTPEDLSVVRAAPERRRRYLDRAVFTRWPGYLAECRAYLRLLRSRNRLLLGGVDAALRESFEEPFARAGARIVARRVAWIEEILPAIEEAFRRIGRIAEGLSLRYQGPPTGTEGETVGWILQRLAERLELDRKRGFTSVGPHTDDVQFHMAGLDARRFASQGQARALILALKVAELENLRARLGTPPLLLLDDVSSELDPDRNRHLVDYLGEQEAQVLLTTTDPLPLLPRLGGRCALWRVRDGKVEAEERLEI